MGKIFYDEVTCEYYINHALGSTIKEVAQLTDLR